MVLTQSEHVPLERTQAARLIELMRSGALGQRLLASARVAVAIHHAQASAQSHLNATSGAAGSGRSESRP